MLDTNTKKGFTLIELLVVLAIIGILAGIVIASVARSRKAGRDARRVTDIKAMTVALSLYTNSCGGYPVEDPLRDVSGLGLDDNCTGWTATPSGTISIFASPSQVLPAETNCGDPGPPNSNIYWYQSTDGTDYSINFCLGSRVADLVAGAHTATPNGIQ